MLNPFPKIFAIGTDYISDLFKDEVEITEKIDGSMFVFGKIDNILYMRSKGQQIFPETPDKMFKIAVDYVFSIQDKLPDNTVFYCEYLQGQHHNVLKYDRVPKNHLILFGVSDETGTKFKKKYEEIKSFADNIDIETVPLLFRGKVNTIEDIKNLLNTESILGNVKIEGIVVKNYKRQFLLGGQPIPIMMGKYVSEKFKEVHRQNWGKEKTSKGKFETFKESFRTEARWQKAIQHLRDAGKLENSPKDIGALIKEIQRDIEEEEKEEIKNFLWKEFGSEITRFATKGFPEFYKEYLLEKQFKK